MPNDPTLIGTVQDVNGATLRVELTNDTVTSLSFVKGEAYRIGQIGSFVRIPLGFVDLYGVVSQVGAGAAPIQEGDKIPYGNRWLQVQLVGEGRRGGHFERGVSQHPTIEDRVHIVTEADSERFTVRANRAILWRLVTWQALNPFLRWLTSIS